MIEIHVELGHRRYPICIGHGASALIPDQLASFRHRHIVLVSSPRIWSLHGAKVEKALRRLGRVSDRVLIPEGERHKSRTTLARLHDSFVAAGLRRDGLVVAFGGGVVGDVTGFAAATYMRGVDWIGLPTTLLSMVDSSIGGKVAINHPRAKNLIGAFHQPRAVIIDPAFLATLPPRELRSGAYEVLKCGLIGDRALFASMMRAPAGLAGWDRAELENAVASACRIKAEVVEKDETEGGLRRVLNLGHTLGHALEAVTHYRRFTHGEAVGWGLLGAAWIARQRGILAPAAFDRIAFAVDHVGPRPRLSDLDVRELLDAVTRDKKALGGRTVFILPSSIGHVTIRNDIVPREVRDALRVMAAHEARLVSVAKSKKRDRN